MQLQRMGRTGRKRQGHVVFLLTEGKEQRDHEKSLENHEKIQQKIIAGKDFHFDLDKSPRILPNEFQPTCIKKEITPPNETPDELDLKLDRRKKLPKVQKIWTLPENVETGFVRASVLGKRKRSENEKDEAEFVHPDALVSPFLSKEDEENVRRYRVHVSPTPKRIDFLDADTNGKIPASSVRKRLVLARQAMKDITRTSRKCTNDDIEELTSSPVSVIADETPPRKVVRRHENTNPFNLRLEGPPKLFERWDERLSSPDDDFPELSAGSLFKGKRKETTLANDKRKKNSEDENDLSTEFEPTPRKRIRVPTFSDDE